MKRRPQLILLIELNLYWICTDSFKEYKMVKIVKIFEYRRTSIRKRKGKSMYFVALDILTTVARFPPTIVLLFSNQLLTVCQTPKPHIIQCNLSVTCIAATVQVHTVHHLSLAASLCVWLVYLLLSASWQLSHILWCSRLAVGSQQTCRWSVQSILSQLRLTGWGCSGPCQALYPGKHSCRYV